MSSHLPKFIMFYLPSEKGGPIRIFEERTKSRVANLEVEEPASYMMLLKQFLGNKGDPKNAIRFVWDAKTQKKFTSLTIPIGRMINESIRDYVKVTAPIRILKTIDG